MRRRDAMRWVLLGVGLGATMAVPAPGRADEPRAAGAAPQEVGVLHAAGESLTGDVYAEPSRWRPLSLGTFFSGGWNEPWASPSAGGGGAPRQGWLNAADGVFYRLAVGTFGYKHATSGNGDVYNGGATCAQLDGQPAVHGGRQKAQKPAATFLTCPPSPRPRNCVPSNGYGIQA